MTTLLKIDRKDGSEQRFVGIEAKAEYQRIRNLYSDERGLQADRDFEWLLRESGFATCAYLYKLKD